MEEIGSGDPARRYAGYWLEGQAPLRPNLLLYLRWTPLSLYHVI